MLPFFIDVGSEIPSSKVTILLKPFHQNVQPFVRKRGFAIPEALCSILFVGFAKQRAERRFGHRCEHAFSRLPTMGFDPAVDIHGRRSFSDKEYNAFE
jgi:hypothetical protein